MSFQGSRFAWLELRSSLCRMLSNSAFISKSSLLHPDLTRHHTYNVYLRATWHPDVPDDIGAERVGSLGWLRLQLDEVHRLMGRPESMPPQAATLLWIMVSIHRSHIMLDFALSHKPMQHVIPVWKALIPTDRARSCQLRRSNTKARLRTS